MAFKIVIIISAAMQCLAALFALWINTRYRWHSAWILFSCAAILMAIERFATLASIWNLAPNVLSNIPFWTATLSSLAIAIFFLGGVSLVQPLFKEIAQAEEVLSAENERLESVVTETEEALQIARDIQQNLLPKQSPQAEGFEISGITTPAEHTSGDYYDYIPLGDGCFFAVIADVSGHGIGPALLMAEARAYLRALCLTRRDAGEILTLANRAIAKDVDKGRFITMQLVFIDPTLRTFSYSSAGHNGYLISAAGEDRVLEAHGPPLGAVGEFTFETSKSILLHKGDLLFLATDGVIETHSKTNELFGIERALEIVRDSAESPVKETLQRLFAAAEEFGNHQVQADDNTAVIIKLVA